MRRDWFSRIAAIFMIAAITPVALPVCAETGSAAPASSDGVTSPTQAGEAAPLVTTPAPRSASIRPVYRGDDALPTAREVTNNPYVGTESMTGDFAFVPPAPVKEPDEQTGTGEDLRKVLGPEIYDRRINVVTPPDTDVEEVIRLLSEKAELNFVYASGVIKGQVTLNLNNVKLGVALNSLLSTQQLAVVREGENVMRIAPRVEVKGSPVDLRTIYIKLNWVLAEQLEGPLKDAMKDTGGAGSQSYTKITAQKETNTLIITDTPGNVALIRDLVNQLDVPEKQVMIEARLIELIISNDRSFGSQTVIEKAGARESLRGPLSENDKSRVGLPVLLGPDVAAADQLISSLVGNPNAPKISFGGTVGLFGKQFAINTVLDALETKDRIHTLASPRVVTLNNQEANIDIKRAIPYQTTVQGAGGQTTVQPQFKDAGISLKVTPNITNTGFVKLRMEAEQLILAGFSGSPPVPIIDRRSAITNVIVKDEDTVVLGGLREINAVNGSSQIPWLGNTPIVGHLFKSSSKTHRKNDLMVFVTPRIIKAPVLSPSENYAFSRLDAHWDLPDYFFDDSVAQRESQSTVLDDPKLRSIQQLKLPEAQ